MNSKERMQSINALLEVRGRVSVMELAEQFNVAQETIRRDLAKLEENGAVRKIHGGAISSQNKFEESLVSRLSQGIPEKHKLSRYAAKLIPSGSTLFIDFGTTTNIFVEHINQLSNLTVFTNSHLIAAAFTENPTCEAYVFGGKYDDKFKSNSGPMVIEGINQYYSDFTVISIGGIDKDSGFSLQDIGEAMTAKAMLTRSTKNIVIADPSKFNRRGIAHVADFHQIDYLVTSEKPDAEMCAVLEANNVVLIASDGAVSDASLEVDLLEK